MRPTAAHSGVTRDVLGCALLIQFLRMNMTQPPPIKPYLRDLVQKLRDQANEKLEESDKRLAHEHAKTKKQQQRAISYETLIKGWFDSLPPEDQRRIFRMDEFVHRFPGRYNTKASTVLIGNALRALGWTEHRSWKKVNRNKRGWKAPLSSNLAHH